MEGSCRSAGQRTRRMRFNFTCKHLSVDPTNACEIESRTERNDTFVFVSKRALRSSPRACRFYSWTTLPPSPSLLACPLAPRSQVVPNEPDSKTCAFLRGRPVRTCLVQRRFRWARGWADFIAKKAQLLGGSMARCRFRYYSYNHKTTPDMTPECRTTYESC